MSFELKILDKDFVAAGVDAGVIPNDEIIEVAITKELSGNYSLDVTLPNDATNVGEISRGRYLQTTEDGTVNKFRLEQINPERSADGNPVVKISAVHYFFELEQQKMADERAFSGTVEDHLEYVLTGTDFSVSLTETGEDYYDVGRWLQYKADTPIYEAVKDIFSTFGGQYKLSGDDIVVIPIMDTLPTATVKLEYSVNNKHVERIEDDTDVVTVLHAKGGTIGTGEDAYTLTRKVYAEQAVRELYRQDRVRYVDFGNIMDWDDFKYITDQYIANREAMRRTYELTVAELKHIDHTGTELESEDFDIDIGTVVQVEDSGLTIDATHRVVRYRYWPLEPYVVSDVTVGDKPAGLIFRYPEVEAFDGDDDPVAPSGPHTLTIELTGEDEDEVGAAFVWRYSDDGGDTWTTFIGHEMRYPQPAPHPTFREYDFEDGTLVRVTATARSIYGSMSEFVEWTGDGELEGHTRQFTMDANKTATAVFRDTGEEEELTDLLQGITSTSDPDPNVGEDGYLWFKHE